MKTPDDHPLLENILSGQELGNSIKTIYRRYFKTAAAFVINNKGSFQDAQDNFQETLISFITIVRNQKFRFESGIGTFLFAINRNKWMNTLKHRRQSMSREKVFSGQSPIIYYDNDLKLQREQVRVQVCRLLGKLGMTCKKILIQYYYEDLPVKQITANLHMNPQVLKNKKCKCQKQLSAMIRKDQQLSRNVKELLLTSLN